MNEDELNKLKEDHEVAYFRGDMVLENPEDYTAEEMAEISNGMQSSTEELERAIREDFKSLSSEGQAKMFEMLVSGDEGSAEFWSKLLLDD